MKGRVVGLVVTICDYIKENAPHDHPVRKAPSTSTV